MGKFQDITGQKFNRLLVLEKKGNHVYPSGQVKFKWLCRCDCGKEIICNGADLKIGKTNSCGCYNIEQIKKANTTHGLNTKSPEYRAWQHMKKRCYVKNNSRYMNYGGRGIKVCDEWLHSFENFLNDLGHKPEGKYSLDRIDVNSNYCKENCKWSTDLEQANNKTNNVKITFNNQTKTISQWSREININCKVLEYRINKSNWTVEKAFTTPVQVRKKAA